MKKTSVFKSLYLSAIIIPSFAFADEFSLWTRSDSSTFMPKLVEAYNALGEHKVNLQIVPTNELVQKYAIAAAGGSAPDALSLDVIFTPAFAMAGQLEDMTEFAKSLPYYGQLSAAHLSVGTVEGKIYGMPFSADSSVLVWNKTLFKQAGLDPDTPLENWDQIYEAAKAVNQLGDEIYGFYFSGNCGGCSIFTFMPLIWAQGGQLFNEDGSQVTFNTVEMKEAINFYRKMLKEGFVPSGSQTDNGTNFFATFASGNVGISPLGAFAIGALNSSYPDLDYGVTYIPGKKGGQSSFAGGDNFVISKGTKKKQAIQSFLEFAYSLEGQSILASNGALPVRADIAEEALKGLDERYILAAKAMTQGKTPFSPVFNDLINSLTGPWTTSLNLAFYGSDADVDKALKAGEKEMQDIIDDY